MNRTRSDSRYLELESSTHCNGYEAESARLSICLKTNTSRTTESPSFFLSPVSLSRYLFFPMLPFSLFRSLFLLLVSYLLVFRVRSVLKVIDFIRELWNISGYQKYSSMYYIYLLLTLSFKICIYDYCTDKKEIYSNNTSSNIISK